MKMRRIDRTEYWFHGDSGYECGKIEVRPDGSYSVYRVSVGGTMDSEIFEDHLHTCSGPLRDPMETMQFWLKNPWASEEP